MLFSKNDIYVSRSARAGVLSAGLGDPWVIYVSAFGGPPPGFRLYVSIALFSHFILRVVGTPVDEALSFPRPSSVW